MTSITEYIKRAKQYGHSALAITDHNNVQAFPDAFNAVAGDEDFKMIFGMEGMLVDDGHRLPIGLRIIRRIRMSLSC